MLTKIQTYLIVTVFTVLIWLYAEGENVKTHELELYVQFTPPAGRELVIDKKDAVLVRASFRCATSQLAQMQAKIAQGVKLELHGDDSAADPYQDVALAPRISSYQPIADLGVTILETRPASMRVRVEPLQERVVPVIGVVEGDVQLAGPPITDITEAAVRLPITRARKIDPSTRLEARVSAENLQDLDVNVQHTLEVPLQLPDFLRGENTSINPQKAKLSFRIRDLREKHTIPFVPVYLVVSPLDMTRYNVSLDEDNRVVRGVEVVGPSDVIERIRKRDLTIYAELLLNTDEFERALSEPQSKQVFIRVPSGVTVSTTPSAITYRVTRAEPPATPAITTTTTRPGP